MRRWLPGRTGDRPSTRRIHQRCRAILATLDIPRPFDAPAFLDHLAKQRGRPIVLQPLPGLGAAGSPSGLWLSTGSADYICYEENTSPLHREQIIFHECAHMLFGHKLALDLSQAERLLPDLGPSLIRRALARTSYASEQEEEAETLASMILQQAYGRCSETTWRVPADSADSADVLERLDRSLRHHPANPI
ncbi:hypothetical protein [Streptomyces sp. NPDC003710]